MPDAKTGPFNLMMLVEGDFTRGENPQAETGRLILAGNSRFMQKEFASRNENLTIFMNLLDWASQDDLLLSIRSKGTAYRPLKRLSDPARLAVKSVLMVTLPLLAIFLGIVIWRLQKTRRAILPLTYKDE